MNRNTTLFNKFRQLLTQPANDLLHVLYPNFCMICDVETPHSGSAVCPVCESELQYTYFENYTGSTTLDQLFWGRVMLEQTYAMLHFKKISDTQKILHALKYKDRPDVAVYFGKLIGERIKNVGTFAALDALIPVPLHPKKEFLRGYNQSRKLAEGISERTSVPVDTEILKRARFAESQTRKAKMSRWESIQNGFQPTKAVRNFKHVALIDDVVTTGSTVETCVRMLQQTLPECKVSVISLAVTR